LSTKALIFLFKTVHLDNSNGRICHKRKLDIYSSTDESRIFFKNQWIKSLKTNQLRAQNATLSIGISA